MKQKREKRQKTKQKLRGTTDASTAIFFVLVALAGGALLLFVAMQLGISDIMLLGVGVGLGLVIAVTANPLLGMAIAAGAAMIYFLSSYLDPWIIIALMSILLIGFIVAAHRSSVTDVPSERYSRSLRGAATIARIIVVIVVAALAYLILWPTLSGWSISLMGFTIPVGVLAFFILIVWALSKAV